MAPPWSLPLLGELVGDAVDGDVVADRGSGEAVEHRQSLARGVLRAGPNVIVDAAALRRHEWDEDRDLATHEGACFTLIECAGPEGVLRRRLARRTAANHDALDATLEVLDFQPKLVSPVAAQEDALLLSTDGDANALVQ